MEKWESRLVKQFLDENGNPIKSYNAQRVSKADKALMRALRSGEMSARQCLDLAERIGGQHLFWVDEGQQTTVLPMLRVLEKRGFVKSRRTKEGKSAVVLWSLTGAWIDEAYGNVTGVEDKDT